MGDVGRRMLIAVALGCGAPDSAGETAPWQGPPPGTETAAHETAASDDGSVAGDGDASTSGSEEDDATTRTTGDQTATGEVDASSSSSSGAVDLGCDTPIFEQRGLIKVIEHGDSHWSVQPLEAGQSFHCMRVEFDLQTVDSQQEILDTYEGCPIFLGIAAVGGTGPEGAPVGSMLFKPWRVGCTPGPDRIELDTFVGGEVQEGPWPLGGLYHVLLDVDIDAQLSSVTLYQDDVQLGPSVTMSLEGVTLEMNRDPTVGFGMTQPATGAYFPDYGATYSNLVVTADIAAV